MVAFKIVILCVIKEQKKNMPYFTATSRMIRENFLPVTLYGEQG